MPVHQQASSLLEDKLPLNHGFHETTTFASWQYKHIKPRAFCQSSIAHFAAFAHDKPPLVMITN
jgi:hypothetical protein